MLLITGATGFIGRQLIDKLIQSHEDIRLLLKPRRKTPLLPKGIALEVAISSLDDERGLRAAMRDVGTIIHLSSAENQTDRPDYEQVEIRGTENLVSAAKSANAERIIYISRIGADKSSSYPIFRAKALAEQTICQSGIPFTILRTTDVFGESDHFTEDIARAMRSSLLLLPLPAGEHITVQPIWIEDLIASTLLILQDQKFQNKILEVGGGEFFSFTKIVQIIQDEINKRKIIFQVSPAYLRIINLWVRPLRDVFPYSSKWLDLLAIDRTCALDSLPRTFGILPARFENHLDYLSD